MYPPEEAGEPWRAVFTENGRRRFRQAMTEAELAAKLEKVTERLRAGAPDMERPGADLIAHYLDPDRLPVAKRWSRRHADTQRRLCQRFAAPVIAAVTCQDITRRSHAADRQRRADRQRGRAAAQVPVGHGDRGHQGRVPDQSAAAGGALAGRGRPVPEPEPSTSGESALWVDPAEIPAAADIGKLGQALAAGPRGELDELMANVAAYAGLRQGELFALTAGQVATDARVITVDRKLIEVAGHLYVEAPKCRKFRSTIYPVRTPDGYPLAGKLAARIEQARAEQQAGTSPLGLIFPSPRFRHWRSSNFDRRVLAPAYRAAGWRDEHGNGAWTWHSLRHVFCTTALFTWKLDATDVSRMAGHANYRITLDMYVGTTDGVLDRARHATQ